MSSQYDLEVVGHERTVERILEIRPEEQANVHAGVKLLTLWHMVEEDIGIGRPDAFPQCQAIVPAGAIFKMMIEKSITIASLDDQSQ